MTGPKKIRIQKQAASLDEVEQRYRILEDIESGLEEDLLEEAEEIKVSNPALALSPRKERCGDLNTMEADLTLASQHEFLLSSSQIILKQGMRNA